MPADRQAMHARSVLLALDAHRRTAPAGGKLVTAGVLAGGLRMSSLTVEQSLMGLAARGLAASARCPGRTVRHYGLTSSGLFVVSMLKAEEA